MDSLNLQTTLQTTLQSTLHTTLQPTLQTLTVVLLVAGCSTYAVWSLMPAALRRSAAAMLLRLPMPKVLATRLRKHAEAAASGCGCSGCDRAEKKPSVAGGTAQPITFHRRPRG